MPQNELFANLTSEELDLSNKLSKKIIDKINANQGVISFSEYMQLALYDKDYGYYNNLLHKFDKQGDFTTAPNLSTLFGQALCNQIIEFFNYMPHNILEIGSGNGKLMLEILSTIHSKIDNYYILETSANSLELQKQQLQQNHPKLFDKVIWVTDIPDNFEGLILVNEVLDAQPCELLHWQNNDLYLRMVGIQDDKFTYIDKPLNDITNLSESYINQLSKITNNLKIPKRPYTSEINTNNRGFIKLLAEKLNTGAILLIDYGYGQSEYYSQDKSNGTLRGFFRHNLVDNVLVYPGLIDITSSVDFSAIADTAIENNLEMLGYTTQANFLLNCGVLQILEQQNLDINSIEYINLSKQLNMLTSPNHMGEVFKVICFAKNINNVEVDGFIQGDKTHTL